MTLADAVTAMLLAAYLHDTQEAVRETAKRCLGQLDEPEKSEEREALMRVVIAESPYEAVLHLALDMEKTSDGVTGAGEDRDSR